MTTNARFPEVFLHYVWKLKLFDFKELRTIDDETIELVNVGTHNHNTGPDFSNARIRIGGTLWAGSVEIHKKSSDWLLHQHQTDKAYNNTILHVVYEHDQNIYRVDGTPIPTLELKNKIPDQYIQRYWELSTSKQKIPCEHRFFTVPASLKAIWLERLVVERLEDKTLEIKRSLELTQNNWEETFYQFLARNFGAKQNSTAFEALAKSLPLKIISKHKNNLFQLEALLLGQAGFLSKEETQKTSDVYWVKLQKEYDFLVKKYQLITLNASSWQFGRMRPANFPTIRLAQFAVLIHQSTHLFSKILVEPNVTYLRKMFLIHLDGYWMDHYRLGEESPKRKKSLGGGTVDLILINTIAPFLFVYGDYKGIEDYKERAIHLLQTIQPEQNSIIANWQNLGMATDSAHDTQGLLQLKKKYCDSKRCLSCSIGHKILQMD
ncbi:MAG: hypothetical protein ACI976_002861 [Aureispira sp.]|jgi:hypothetical protein